MATEFKVREKWEFECGIAEFEPWLIIVDHEPDRETFTVAFELSETGYDRDFHFQTLPLLRVTSEQLRHVVTKRLDKRTDPPETFLERYDDEDEAPKPIECIDNLNASLLQVVNGWLDFEKCIELGELERLETFLRHDPDLVFRVIPSEYEIDDYPLHVAARQDRGFIVHFLVDHGADVNARNATGSTPLHIAASYNNADVVDVLLALGADPTLVDEESARPLDQVTDFSGESASTIARLLREHGAQADLNHLAALGNLEELRETLQENPRAIEELEQDRLVSSLLNTVDNWFYDNVAFKESDRDRYRETLSLLLEHGADTSEPNLLLSAVTWPDTSFARMLLEHGVDPNSGIDEENGGGDSLLDTTDSPELKELLRERGARSLEEPDLAVLHLSSYLRYSPQDPDYLRERGEAWAKLGQYQRALDDFDRAVAAEIELKHEDAETLNARAWFLCTCPDANFRDGRAALRQARRAYRLDGGKSNLTFGSDARELSIGSDYVETVAAAYAELGQFERAVVELESTISTENTERLRKFQELIEQYQQERPTRAEPVSEETARLGRELGERVDAADADDRAQPDDDDELVEDLIDDWEGEDNEPYRIEENRSLEIYDHEQFDESALRDVMGRPGFATLRCLDLDGFPLGPEVLNELSRVLRDVPLEELSLANLNWRDRHAAEALQSIATHELGRLDLNSNKLGNTATRVLASKPAPWLKELDLSDNRVRLDGFAALIDAEWFPQLQVLDLGYNRLGHSAGKSFAGIPDMPVLRNLHLEANLLSDSALEGMAQWEMPQLEQLDLSHNRFRLRGIRALAQASWLSRVKDLNLSTTSSAGMNDECAAALLATPRFDRLEFLTIDNGGMHRPPFAQFTRERFPALKYLSIQNNSIGPNAIAELIRCDVLEHLTNLQLDGNRIGDEGVKQLVSSPAVARLDTLDISNNRLTANAARALVDSPYLEKLEMLWLDENDMDAAGRKLLREHFGNRVNLFEPW